MNNSQTPHSGANEQPRPAACERVLGRLPEYVDGGLPPLEEALDRGHLEACPSCAAEAASWTAFHGILTTAVPADGALDRQLFEGLEARLAGVVIARPTAAAARSRMVTSLMGAAASLVALFGLEAMGTAMSEDDGRGAPLISPASLESIGALSNGSSGASGAPSSLRDLLPNIFPSSLPLDFEGQNE
jgi:anti-sigma factor RsiW